MMLYARMHQVMQAILEHYTRQNMMQISMLSGCRAIICNLSNTPVAVAQLLYTDLH